MYKTILLMAMLGSLGACKKEYSLKADPTKTTSIDLVYDGEDIIRRYDANKPNDFAQYSFGGVAGTYFGYISSFTIDDHQKLEIRLGTMLSQHSTLSREESLELLSPGKRHFGSLGVFTSYPQIKANCAEVAYTDDSDIRWSSTRITEKHTDYGIEALVDIVQPQGQFIVDSVASTTISDTLAGFHVQGHFNCTLYEVNGQRTKAMEGSFVSVVSDAN